MLKLLIIEEHLFLRTPASSRNIIYNAEGIVQRCPVKKVLLEILRNSQESTCARVPFSNKVAEFCEIFKNNFLHRTPLVAASDNT